MIRAVPAEGCGSDGTGLDEVTVGGIVGDDMNDVFVEVYKDDSPDAETMTEVDESAHRPLERLDVERVEVSWFQRNLLRVWSLRLKLWYDNQVPWLFQRSGSALL